MSGALPSDRATRASTEPASSLGHSAGIPSAEEYPHLTGCLQWACAFVGTYLALTSIAIFAGYLAAFWFGLGAFLTGILALWEVGHNAKKRGAAQAIEARRAETGTGSVHESKSND